MTVLFVTHDVEEAVVLANKIVVLQARVRPESSISIEPIDLAYPRDPISACGHGDRSSHLRISLSI